MLSLGTRCTVSRAWRATPWWLQLGSCVGLIVLGGMVVARLWPDLPPRLAQAMHRGVPPQALPLDMLSQVVAPHVAQGAFTRVAAVYRQALAQHPTEVTGLLRLAHLYAVQHQPDAAEVLYQQAVALTARLTPPQRPTAAAPAAPQRLEDAVAAYRQAVVFATLAQSLAAQRAELWLYQQQFDAVAAYADQLLHTHDGLAAGRTLQGRLALARQQVPEAITAFQHARRAAPDSAAAHYGLGVAYLQQQQVHLATHAWATAHALAPAVVELARAVAHVHMEARAFTHALAVGQRLLAVQPHHPTAHRIVGQAWLALGEPTKGLAALQAMTAQAPHEARSYYDLGIGYRQYQHESAALQAFEQALILDPSGREALRQMVDMALVKGDTAQARRRVLRHLQVAPHHPEAYTLLSRIQFAEDERSRGTPKKHELRKRQRV